LGGDFLFFALLLLESDLFFFAAGAVALDVPALGAACATGDL